MPTRLDENNTCTVQDKEMGGGAMLTLLDENIISTVQGNGGGAMPTRLDDNNTCTVQTNNNPVGARVEHDIDL